MKKYYEVVEPVFDFLNERGNPYKAVGSVKLHHAISKHVIPSDKSGCMLSFSENGSKNYLKFCEGRFLKKKKKEACWHYKGNHCATIFAKRSEKFNWK